MYRLRKFARRNKMPLFFGAVVASALVLVLILATAGVTIASLAKRNYELQGYRPVYVTTEPAGARVAFVPIDERTGEPNPDPAVIARPSGTTPLTVELKPGRYFVEAVLPGSDEPDFAEVYITIPRTETTPDSVVKANRSNGLPDDLYRTRILIPKTSQVIAGMVAVPIDEEFRRRDILLPELLYVDAKETTPDDSEKAGASPRDVSSSPTTSLDTRNEAGSGSRFTFAEHDGI